MSTVAPIGSRQCRTEPAARKRALEDFQELLRQWRPPLSAMLGLGAGFSALAATTGIMAPHLMGEFGWSRAEFAGVNALSIVMVPAFPFVGRLADIIGVRRTALIGVLMLPVTYLGFSQQNGTI